MRNKLTLLVLALAVVFSFGIATEAQALVTADIVFIIDESGSMGDDQANVIANLGTFTTALTNAGIDAQYGLVGFGRAASPNIHIVSQLTDASGIATALGTLVATGGTEPGFGASIVAINGIAKRQGSVRNYILITDEDSDGSETEAQVDALLKAENGLYNAITGPDFVAGTGSYETLATNNGGVRFDILAFRANPASFIQNFSDTKVQEIINQANPTVPEPATMALLGSGLMGMVGFRRKRS